MLYEIVWSEWAEIQLDNIFNYYIEKASLNTAYNLIEGIILEPERLRNSPYIGQDEISLSHRRIKYRYIIHKNYKLIYSIDEQTHVIKIVDVFDTRQNPEKMERI